LTRPGAKKPWNSPSPYFSMNFAFTSETVIV
jgi:hypothetical protein